MIKEGIKLYWNEDRTKYAILVCNNGRVGWTVTNIPEVAYDRRIVEYVMDNMDSEWWKAGRETQSLEAFYKSRMSRETDAFLRSIGYEDIYTPPLKYVQIVWIDAGRNWRIRDGGEVDDFLEFEDEIDWNCGLDEAMKDKDYISSVKKAISESLSEAGNSKVKVCVRGKSSCDGCEFLMVGGTCIGVVYPTCPPQFDKCEFLR